LQKIDVDVATPSAKKKYNERASLEEERKEKELTDYHRSLSLQEHRSFWHPKKFVWVDDQSRRVFIES
jgi:hypothetical protein